VPHEAAKDAPLLTAAEAGRRLGLTEERVYRLSAIGVIPRVVIGRLVRFSPFALDEFVASGGRRYDSVIDSGPTIAGARTHDPADMVRDG
jgi:excisionase family DNA binding protein